MRQRSDRTVDLEARTQGSPLSPNQWDAKLYETRHSFVWQYGAVILELLAPKTGERILETKFYRHPRRRLVRGRVVAEE